MDSSFFIFWWRGDGNILCAVAYIIFISYRNVNIYFENVLVYLMLVSGDSSCCSLVFILLARDGCAGFDVNI